MKSKPARVGSTKAKKYVEDSDEEEEELRPVAQEDSQESLPVPKKSTAVVETVDLHEEDEEAIADAVGDKFDVSSSDEEIVRKVAKKAAPRKLGPSQIKEGSTKVGSGKPVPKKGAAAKKKFVQSSDDEKPAKKAKGRQVMDSGDDDSDFEVEKIVAKPRATGKFCGKAEYWNRLIDLGSSYDSDTACDRWTKEGQCQLWTGRFVGKRLLKRSFLDFHKL